MPFIDLYWRRQWHPTPVLLPGKSRGRRSLVRCSPWGHEESDTTERLHFHFSLSLEKEMATHSSVLAWRIPGTGEPGGLPSVGSHRVRHDWSDLAAADEHLFVLNPPLSSPVTWCPGLVPHLWNGGSYSKTEMLKMFVKCSYVKIFGQL